jgi:hypothetical protein
MKKKEWRRCRVCQEWTFAVSPAYCTDHTDQFEEEDMASTSNDPLVVRTDDLARAIERWIEDDPITESDYASIHSQAQNDGEVTPLINRRSMLVERAGITARVVTRILRRETSTTSLDLADKILVGMYATELLVDGTINVFKSPKWTLAHFLDYMRAADADPTPYLTMEEGVGA